MIANDTDRFGVAVAAIKGGALVNARVAAYAHEKCALLQHMKAKEKEHIYKHGKGWAFYFFHMYSNQIQDRDGLFDVPEFKHTAPNSSAEVSDCRTTPPSSSDSFPVCELCPFSFEISSNTVSLLDTADKEPQSLLITHWKHELQRFFLGAWRSKVNHDVKPEVRSRSLSFITKWFSHGVFAGSGPALQDD